MRRNIASLAARFMAQDGIGDYGFAKRKAARQLRVAVADALPTNEEIEIELRAYQSIYHSEEQPARLLELRRAALDLMRRLERFSPYLTGHVLEGTAGRFAMVELRLYPLTEKDVEIFLLSNNIPYTHAATRRTGDDAPELQLALEWQGIPFDIGVFGAAEERVQRRNVRNGRAAGRASIAAVQALIEACEP
jgi:hypothetical protein